MVVPKPTSRERAARALCRFHGNQEDALFEGKPMWQSFIFDVDVVALALGLRLPKPSPDEEVGSVGLHAAAEQ